MIFNADWYDKNLVRSYPLSDTVSKLDTTGSFSLPDSLLTDFVLPVASSLALDYSKFHVAGLSVFSGIIVLTFGYDGQTIGTLSVSAAGHTKNKAYYMSCTGDFQEATATVVVGDLTETLAAGGSYTFTAAAAAFVPTAVRPALGGVSSIGVFDGSVTNWYTGDIELYPGRNIQFTVTQVDGRYRIQIDAISDVSLGSSCACTEAEQRVPIQTVNLVSGDANSNLQLIPMSSCLTIDAETGMLKFVDNCAKPCCTCDDLEPVKEDINMLRLQVETDVQLSSQLQGNVSELLSKVLAAQMASIS